MREIWCTLGPASLNERVVSRLEEIGVTLFRLNLSHVDAADLPDTIRYLQGLTSVPICLDSEGAQIRTGRLAGGRFTVRRHDTVVIPRRRVGGGETRLNLYPDYVADHLQTGDLLRVDSDVLVQVVAGVDEDRIVARVLNGGTVGQNKAVTLLGRGIAMPPLTEKDRRCLEIGRTMGIRHVALSFAHRASDVHAIREIATEGTRVISKIECPTGLERLREITSASDALLIDRGDLSREVDLA